MQREKGRYSGKTVHLLKEGETDAREVKHGNGKVTFSDGSWVEGTWGKDQLKSGTFHWPHHNAKFSGTFSSKGIRQGKGVLKQEGGLTIDGFWDNDVIEGKATVTDANN